MFGFSTCGDGHARGYGAALGARYSGRHGEDGDVDVPVVLIAHHQVHQQGAGTASAERTGGDAQIHALFRSLAASLFSSQCFSLPRFLLEAKYDDFRVVIGPLAHGQVKVAVDFHPCKQTHVMDLKCKKKENSKSHIHNVTRTSY